MAGNKAVDPSLGNQAATKSSNQSLQFIILIVAMLLSVIVGYCIRGRRMLRSNTTSNRTTTTTTPNEEENENTVAPEDQPQRKKFVDEHLSSTEWTTTNDDNDIEQGTEDDEEAAAAECPVCLAPFENGDQVASSSNPECPHVFHHECMYQWLLKKKDCPMCRNIFLVVVEEKEEERHIFVSALENSSSFPRSLSDATTPQEQEVRP